MSRHEVPHPDILQLQSFFDGELVPERAYHLQEHVARCALCGQTLEEWRALRATLDQARPRHELFCGEGEFWARLAGKLDRSRPATWSALRYLPPFLLGALGTLLDGLMSLVLAAYFLMGLGMIPSVATKVTDWLRELLSSELLGLVFSGLGWSSSEVMERVTLWWSALGRSQQESLLAGVLLLSLGPLWAAAVLLYLSWAMCWPRAERWEHEGGR